MFTGAESRPEDLRAMAQGGALSREELAQLIRGYFGQLTKGCGREACCQPAGRCATVDGPVPAKAAAKTAFTLAVTLGASGLCDAVNPSPMEGDDPVASNPLDSGPRTNTDLPAASAAVVEDVAAEPMEVVAPTTTEGEPAQAMDESEGAVVAPDPALDTVARFRQLMDELDTADNPKRALVGFAYDTFGPPGMDRLMSSAFCDNGGTEHGVDLDGLREVYNGLLTGEFGDDIRDILGSAMGNTVSLELLRIRSFPSERSLRVFVILFEAPVLDDIAAQEALLPALLKSVGHLRDGERSSLARWWAADPIDELRRKLSIVQQFVTLRVLSQCDTPGYNMNHDDDLGAAVKCIGLIHLANTYRASSDRFSELEFVNDGINDMFRVSPDFEVWKAEMLKGWGLIIRLPEHAFSFCHFPYMLSLANKVKILTTENKVLHEHEAQQRQRRNLMAAMHGSLEGLEDSFVINVNRDNLVRDALLEISFHVLKNPEIIRQPLKVHFIGEEGLDYGGVRKEFFQLIIKELFDPIYGMFVHQEDSRLHYFAPRSLEAPEEYRLLGLVLGLALYNNTILDLHFPPAVYKKLKEEPAGLPDLAILNPDLARGLQQLLAYPDDDVEDVFSLTFSVPYEHFGEQLVEELVPGGADRPVTAADKEEYVQLYVDYVMNTSISAAFAAFFDGFWSTSKGSEGIELFSSSDLELLIVGTQDLDFDILRKITKYDGFELEEKTPVVQWFWELAEHFTEEEKRLLLAFSTGSDRVPVGGLEKISFIIAKQGVDSDQLPTSHTCFNVLMLPEYSSKEKLERLLSIALRNAQGFGMI